MREDYHQLFSARKSAGIPPMFANFWKQFYRKFPEYRQRAGADDDLGHNGATVTGCWSVAYTGCDLEVIRRW